MSAVTWVFDSVYPKQLQLQSDKKQDILFFSKHKTRQSLNSNFVGKVIGREKKGWLWWRMGLLFRDIQNTCTPTYRLTTWSSNAFVKSKVATFIKNLVYLVAAIERGAFCFCFKQFTTNNYEFRLKPRINQMVLRHFS